MFKLKSYKEVPFYSKINPLIKRKLTKRENRLCYKYVIYEDIKDYPEFANTNKRIIWINYDEHNCKRIVDVAEFLVKEWLFF